jgi:ABC-type nitrate/sulfonate/bicarbonate transport system ATPase subunit
MLRQTGIEDKAKNYPKSLSGGQAQRVAIARAFLYDGDVILMDEPFSSLDLKLKIKIMELFSAIRQKNNKTCVFVTHDVDEAVYLSDRIIILRQGEIIYDCQNNDKGLPYGENSCVRANLVKELLK